MWRCSVRVPATGAVRSSAVTTPQATAALLHQVQEEHGQDDGHLTLLA